MPLKFRTDPAGEFIDRRESFLQTPGIVSGMTFDDAVVKLKRHLLSELKDESLAIELGALAKLIRGRKMEQLRITFDTIVERIKNDDRNNET